METIHFVSPRDRAKHIGKVVSHASTTSTPAGPSPFPAPHRVESLVCVVDTGRPNTDAAFVLVSKKGYEIRDDVTGAYCRTLLTQKAQHGYSENFEEMRASFMLTGEGIEQGFVENVHLIDVAPTLAGIMGFTLPDAEGRSVLAG